MKLQEIRTAYLHNALSRDDAASELHRTGHELWDLHYDLLDLWDAEQARQVERPSEPPAQRSGLGLSSSLELIDNGYISGTFDLADATELWHEAGLSEAEIKNYLYVMDACRSGHESTWTAPEEAPDWIRQLSRLVKLYMHGEINSWAALKQLDPKDEYPDTVGAILAHVIERRDSIADLAARARKDPTILDDGIEYCRLCGRARAARELSRKGLCKGCRFNIHTRVMHDLTNHSGPYYRKWRDAMLKAMYRLEDELREENMADSDEPEPPHMNTYIADLKKPHP